MICNLSTSVAKKEKQKNISRSFLNTPRCVDFYYTAVINYPLRSMLDEQFSNSKIYIPNISVYISTFFIDKTSQFQALLTWCTNWMCLVRSPRYLDLWEQWGQEKGRSPVCVRRCSLRRDMNVNRRGQKWQTKEALSAPDPDVPVGKEMVDPAADDAEVMGFEHPMAVDATRAAIEVWDMAEEGRRFLESWPAKDDVSKSCTWGTSLEIE